MKEFIEICKKTQPVLKDWLKGKLLEYYDEIVSDDGYLYAKGSCPVLLTAHMDTVHKEPVKDVVMKVDHFGCNIISSPQGIGGDDRCGVWMILQILKKTQHRPTILFCEDEEIGGVGSNKFCKSDLITELSGLKFMIELDRANASDLVYYEDDNQDFHKWCSKVTGYRENYGSFSDISHLSPATGISSVNISCGYYKAHTTDEYVVMEEMEASTKAVIALLDAAREVDQFEYVEAEYVYDNWSWNRNRYRYCDEVYLIVKWWDIESNVQMEDEYIGTTVNDCWGQFFTENESTCFKDVIDWEVI